MNLNSSLRVLLLAVAATCTHLSKAYSVYEQSCNKLTLNPYFETDMVIGKPWRIYYSWNMRLDDKCVDMVFSNATPTVVSRIFHDMYEYLESQPNWDAATLLVSMGLARHEMLLFADQGSAGQFVGVPNVVRDGNISPDRKVIPLFKIYMKLFNDGKYLVLSDCNIGVSTLSALSYQGLSRKEMMKVVSSLELGEGHPACIRQSDFDDRMNLV